MTAEAATAETPINPLRVPRKLRINPAKVSIMWQGSDSRHVKVTLEPGMTVVEALQTPDIWELVQERREIRLARGYYVTIVSHDGATIADSAVVKKTERGSIWLSKPIRMLDLGEQQKFFENRQYRVVPNGTGFSIQTIRDGRVEEEIFQTVDRAKMEILRREPVRT